MPRKKENVKPECNRYTGELLLVEKVLKKRLIDKAMMYYVKWQNLPRTQNSWILESDVCLLTPSRASNLSNADNRTVEAQEIFCRRKEIDHEKTEMIHDDNLGGPDLENLVSFFAGNEEYRRFTKQNLASIDFHLIHMQKNEKLNNILSRYEATRVGLQMLSADAIDVCRNSYVKNEKTITSCETSSESAGCATLADSGGTDDIAVPIEETCVEASSVNKNECDFPSSKNVQIATPTMDTTAQFIQETILDLEDRKCFSPSSDVPNLMIMYVHHHKVECGFMNCLSKLKDDITTTQMLLNERTFNLLWNIFLTRFQKRKPGICYMRAALEKFVKEKMSNFYVTEDSNVESQNLFFSFVNHLLRLLQARIITLDDTIQLVESLNVRCY